jgi:hypothetical protein
MRLPTNAKLFTAKSSTQLTLLVSAMVIVGEFVLVGVAYSLLAPSIIS